MVERLAMTLQVAKRCTLRFVRLVILLGPLAGLQMSGGTRVQALMGDSRMRIVCCGRSCLVAEAETLGSRRRSRRRSRRNRLPSPQLELVRRCPNVLHIH